MKSKTLPCFINTRLAFLLFANLILESFLSFCLKCMRSDVYVSVDERKTPSSLLTTRIAERCMQSLSGKHNKCITHEKPSKKRENIAPMLLTYIMFLCPFIQLVFIFGNATNKRGFSQLLRLLIYLFILLHTFGTTPETWLWFHVDFK